MSRYRLLCPADCSAVSESAASARVRHRLLLAVCCRGSCCRRAVAMAPHPAVSRAEAPKTAADNRQQVADQACGALAKLRLSTPAREIAARRLAERARRDASIHIIDGAHREMREAYLTRKSRTRYQSLPPTSEDRVKEGYADLSDGYGTLRPDKAKVAPSRPSTTRSSESWEDAASR